MSNAKRLLSAVMALVMAFSMFSCLGTVFASATLADGQSYTMTKTYRGVDYHWNGTLAGEADWTSITRSNFAEFNGTKQDYDNGFGIKDYADLVSEYGSDKFVYVGVEVYEEDGELTDHIVQPGDVLTLVWYVKSNAIITNFTNQLLATRSFFDVNGPGYTSATWSSKTDKGADGLNSTGYRGNMAVSGDNLNSDCTLNDPDDAQTKIVITCKPVSSTSSYSTANTSLSTAFLYSLDYISTVLSIENAEYADGLDAETDEWMYQYQIKVRSTSEKYQNTGTINPFEQDYTNSGRDLYIGVLGYDYYTSYEYYYKMPTMYYGISDGMERADEYPLSDEGVIIDTRDATHVFAIGTPEDYPYTPGEDGPTTYTITWKNADGTTLATDIVEEGTVPVYDGETPVKAADAQYTYTFAGWDAEPVAATANAVYTATYSTTVNEYTVTWKNYDGSVLATDTVPYGTTPAYTGATPTKPRETQYSYEFTGWSPAVASVTGDAEYTAQFAQTELKYTVTYMSDGKVVDTQQYVPGAAVTAIGNPSKTGYTFNSWSPALPATMPAEDITVNATWDINTYKVTYKVDGEEYKTVDVTFGDAIPAEAAPTKTGHTFSGWSAAPATMPANDIEITGTFTAKSYTMTFLSEAGATIKSGLQTYGQVITLPADSQIPAVTGKTFAYWEAADGTVITAENAATMTVPAADTTWTAVYVGNAHTVTFTIDGVFYQEKTVNYGAKITAPEAPEREGYKFNTWTLPNRMPDNDITLDASYSINSYKLTFVFDNGTANATSTVTYGAAVTAPAAPTKTGYTFAGWDAEVPATMPANDVTITALWTINQWTITYDYAGGTDAEGRTSYSETVDYGTALTAPVVTKEGSSFASWSPSVPKTMPDNDVNVTAQWTVGQYTVTYWVRDLETGTYAKFATDSYAYNADVTARAVKTATGWTYSAWEPAVPATMPANNVDVYSTGTKNVYHDIWYGKDGEIYDERDVEFGAAIPDVGFPSYDGYTDPYWAPADKTQKAEDMTFEYRSSAGSVNYTILTRTEQLDGTYAEETQTLSNNTGATVTINDRQKTKTGYTLDESASVLTAVVAGNGSTQLVLTFNLNEYNFVITDNAGTTTTAVKYGAPIAAPTAAAKEGYEATSWSWTRDNGNTISTLPATMPAYNINGTANYKIKSYALTYKVDGEVYKSTNVVYGTAITAEAAPTKTGYTFSGWSEVPATMPANDVEITGTFTVNTYTITYMNEGVEYAKITAAYGTDITAMKPADPTKEGSTFTAWYPSVPATMPAGDMVTNANYSTVTYHAYFMDGDKVLADKKTAYGAQIEEPAAPTKVGYTFTGWDQEVGIMGAEDITFNATWEAKTLTATFYAVEGDAVAYETNASVVFGTTFAAPETDPERAGYTFAGWKLAGATSAAQFPYTMDAEGLTFVGIWNQDTSMCRVESVVNTAADTYYARGYAEYKVTLKEGFTADKIFLYDGTKTLTFSKSSFDSIGADSGVISIDTVDGKQVWTVGLVLAAAQDTYKAYCQTTDGFKESLDTALVFDVAYAAKPGDVVADEFTSYAISDTQTWRGQYLTWTFNTAADVTWIKLTGTYTAADGTKKTLTTLYKYDTTSANVTRTVVGDTATWVINMRFTYSVTDLTIDEAWTISYRVGTNTEYYVANEGAPVMVKVGYNEAALTPTAPTYDKYTLVSATADANVTAGQRSAVTIVTTDDCTKVRIGTNGKFTTYQTTTASNVSYTDADGLRTWTIDYKFTGAGSTEYTVNARGSAWGEAQTFTVVVG